MKCESILGVTADVWKENDDFAQSRRLGYPLAIDLIKIQ